MRELLQEQWAKLKALPGKLGRSLLNRLRRLAASALRSAADLLNAGAAAADAPKRKKK